MQRLSEKTLLQGGKYRIEAVLGQGSFGITYVATHTVLNKKVAIKEFFMKELNGRSEDGSITGMSDGSLSIDYARKFQKEAKNLATLEHPNIVSVKDLFAENGTYYYVMDYIEGENLNDYIKHGNVSAQEAVSIIRDVAKALEYMHNQKHMLHLDLKPGNVMRRSSDGHIFLIDFGLSKHYSSSGQPETSTTIGLGTPGYAPIEQANQAKNGDFRPTIDVYALGATFFKLLTGETPPAASDLVSDDELLAERLRLHHVDDAISRVVVNAMLPNVRKRIQSVSAFIQMLGASEGAGMSSVASVNTAANSEETQVMGGGYSINTTNNVRQDNRRSNYGSDKNVKESSKQSNSFFAGPMAIVLCTVLALLIILFCARTCSYTDGTISDGCDTIDTMAVDTMAVDSAYYEPYSSNGYSENVIQENEEKQTDVVGTQESMKPMEEADDDVYDVVEQMPSFHGGMNGLIQYLSSNIKYPPVAEENGIQGRVICSFIVECDGSISDVRVTKSVAPSLDKEACRVIKSMPRWIPGKQNGSTVRVKYTLPITFRLQ